MSHEAAFTCPKCKLTDTADRIRRPMIVKLMFFWLPLRRYRCLFCLKTTYRVHRRESFNAQLQHS